MSEPLKPCPCGNVPTALKIGGKYDGDRWAWVSGDCCGEWFLGFRCDGYTWDSDECKRLAIEVWNRATGDTAYQQKGCRHD